MPSFWILKDTIYIHVAVSPLLPLYFFPVVFESMSYFQIRTKNCMQYLYSHSSGPAQYKSKRYTLKKKSNCVLHWKSLGWEVTFIGIIKRFQFKVEIKPLATGR